ncbi:MAG: hypothetical protein DBY19_02380 [Clostridia bacterium]|nr:MAG: hypothetical protein DBY19_02380 [Clostridia bacterium]
MLYIPFPFELILDYNIFEQFAGFLPIFDPLRQTLTLWNKNRTVIGNRSLFALLMVYDNGCCKYEKGKQNPLSKKERGFC